jgi:Domain of unknown function (DUF4124)
MHLCRSWIALGVFAIVAGSLAVQAAVVYKWTDPDGVVHFSDQPVPGAERIVTASGNPRTGGIQLGANAPAAAKPKPGSATGLTQLAITSPAHQETITGNQPVNVHLAMEPVLKSTQAITWFLNGSPLSQAPDATQFTLEDLSRGTYVLGATVTDQASGETKSAESVTFYVMRTSLLSPQHKAP